MNTIYNYQGDITQAEKETIIATVEHNLDNKMTSYLSKVQGSEDVSLQLKVTIHKNRKTNNTWFGFNGVFVFSVSGMDSLRYEREDFKNLTDLINHAFDHFKETLASK